MGLLTNDMFRAHRAARQKDEVTMEYAISKKDSPRWAPVPSKPNVTHIGYDMATKKCTAHAPRLLHLPPQLHLTVAAVAVRPDSQIEKWVEELGPKLGGTTKLAEVVRDDKGGPKKIIIKSIGIPRDKLSYTAVTGSNLRAPARPSLCARRVA